MQRLEEIHEIETPSGELVVIQIFGKVADAWCQANLVSELLSPFDGARTDVDAGQRPKLEAAALENPIEVPRTTAERQGITRKSIRKVSVPQPVNPVRVRVSGDQVVVIRVDLRNAGPGNALQVLDEPLGCEPIPMTRDTAHGLGCSARQNA